MRKHLLLMPALLLALLTRAQVPGEAYPLVNGLSDLWSLPDVGPAVDSTLRLNRVYRPFFVERMHDTFAQSISGKGLDGSKAEYLKRLYEQGDASIRLVLEPLRLWDEAYRVTDQAQADALILRMNVALGDTVCPDSKAERYALLLVKTLNGKKLGSGERKAALVSTVRAHLRRHPLLHAASGKRPLDENRAWNRYLLAYAAYLSWLDEGKEADLREAAAFSPDATDRLYKHAYFYDAHLLEGRTPLFDFRPFLFDRLVQSGQKEEALSVLLERCFAEPVEANMKQLKAFHAESGNKPPLQTLWYDFVNERMKPVPSLAFDFPDGKLDLTQKRRNWLFFDVWGTWCGPCCRELPEFNATAARINGDAEAGLKVYSLSYSSTDLKNFLQKNGYTFPVVEVGREVTQAFGVTGFPTKILVSPSNRYLIVPFGANWPEYVKGYMLK